MATSFLNKAGLTSLWAKIKATFALKSEIPDSTSDLTNDSGFITSIPLATTSTLGGVIVGDHINVANDGTISLDVATDAQVETFLRENGFLTTNTIDSATIDNATVE